MRGKNELGEALRRHRRERGVTGTELASSVGVGQGTISKIESGRLVPDLGFITKFAHTLRLKKQDASRLLQMAGLIPGGATPESVLQYLPADFVDVDWSERRQLTVAQAEAKSTNLRVFSPLLVPGLLQSSAYVRHAFQAAGVGEGKSLERAIQARLTRQRLLKAPEKQFCFIICEAALHCRIGPVAVLKEQIDHLKQLTLDGGVDLFMIPLDAPFAVVPPPAFYLLDRRVYIELPHGDLWLLERSNAFDIYDRLFKLLARASIKGEALAAKLDELSQRLG